MGTNYYLLTKNKKLKEKYFDFNNDYELTDKPCFGYQIHICKLSSGWKSLWQAHPAAYNSVSEFEEFVRKHEKSFLFLDEYHRRYSIDEFLEEIKYFDRDKSGKIREQYNGSPLICHEEYQKEERKKRPWSCCDIKYWQDKDGYDFTDRWFC